MGSKVASIAGHAFVANALIYVGPIKKSLIKKTFYFTVGLAGGFSFVIEGILEEVEGYRQHLVHHIVMNTGKEAT